MSRTVSVDPDPVVYSVLARAEAHSALARLVPGLVPHQVFVLAGDGFVAAAKAHLRELTAVWLFLLRFVHLLHLVVASVALAFLGLVRVRAQKATPLRAVPMAELSRGAELARRVCLRLSEEAKLFLRVPEAARLRRAEVAHLACLFHRQPVPAIRLTRAPALHLAPRDRLCRAELA